MINQLAIFNALVVVTIDQVFVRFDWSTVYWQDVPQMKGDEYTHYEK